MIKGRDAIFLLQGRHLELLPPRSPHHSIIFGGQDRPSIHFFCFHFPLLFTSNLDICMERRGALPPGKMFCPFISDTSETPVPSNSTNSNLRMGPHKTTGEWRRKQKLLSDPMAMVISPTMVKCRQCNREIKLSMKCAYDNFHWKTHRDRCIKATKKKKKALVSHLLPTVCCS